jgi:hypothetical protein
MFAGQPQLGQVDDRLDGLALAEEETPATLGVGPPAQQFPGDVAGPAVLRLTPAADIVAEKVDQGQIVPLLLLEERLLRRAGALGLVPVARRPAVPGTRRRARGGIVNPVVVRLLVGRTDDRLLDRLNRDVRLLFHHLSSSRCTCITSLPRGSITFTATHRCFPAGNGSDTVPLSLSKTSSAMMPFLPPSARASLSQAERSGKNACVMQNVRPS